MDIKSRLKDLQRRMEVSDQIGTSIREVQDYEKSLKEIILVNRWLNEKCSEITTIKRVIDGKWGFNIYNDTGLDFDHIKIKLQVYKGEKIIQKIEAKCGKLPNGQEGYIKFDEEPNKGSTVIDGEGIEYAL